MFDMHSELSTFFKDHVRLKPDSVEELDVFRQRNIDRLNTGLEKLEYNGPVKTPTQGGRAMKTLNQTPENNPDADYDIDTAAIFKRDDLPENPLDARKRVLAGVKEGVEILVKSLKLALMLLQSGIKVVITLILQCIGFIQMIFVKKLLNMRGLNGVVVTQPILQTGSMNKSSCVAHQKAMGLL